MGTMKCKRREEIGILKDSSGNKFPDQWREIDNCCTYCGSLHPDEVIKLIRRGYQIVPTDKDYKILVKQPDVTVEVYFQHFDEHHIKDFIDLHNRKIMNIDIPGYFYTPPHFMKT